MSSTGPNNSPDEQSKDFEYDAFLSYASAAAPFCADFALRLRSQGVRVWFDQWELKPGDNPKARLNDGLRKSRKMIAVWEPEYFSDEAVRAMAESLVRQYSDTLKSERPLIPAEAMTAKSSSGMPIAGNCFRRSQEI
jgi:hypothetical protein